MRKLLSLMLVVTAILTWCVVPVFASTTEIAVIELKLPDSMEQRENQRGYVYLSRDGKWITEAKSEADGMVIEFWVLPGAEKLRIGAKDPQVDGTLGGSMQVRRDIPLSELQSGNFKIVLTKDAANKWMLYINGLEVNDRNWNQVKPDNISEAEWKKTDNIMYCTDFSTVNTNSGTVGKPDDNALIDFLANFPGTFTILTDNSILPFTVVKTEVIKPAETASSQTAAEQASSPQQAETAAKTTSEPVAEQATTNKPVAQATSNPKTGDATIYTLLITAILSGGIYSIRKNKSI